MVKRSCCLYNNKFVRIEEFYTICEGKQINIPEKIEKYRELGKQKELNCPCGCGLKLEIVAGEKMLRKQHFREKKGQDRTLSNCKEIFESETTTNSKIVLKCWLDDIFQLKQEQIRFNVPINQLYDVKRRYEYTHYVGSRKFGLSYERISCNWDSEKIEFLLNQSQERLLHIMDISNFGCNGQYPEYKMRVQRLQGFCVFLDTHNNYDYYDADFIIAIYEKDYRGLWKEIVISKGKLSLYHFDEEYNILYLEQNITKKVEDAKEQFRNEQEIFKAEAEEKAIRLKEKQRREQEEAEQKKKAEKKAAEEARRMLEERKEILRKENEEQQKKQREERKKARLDFVKTNPKLATFFEFLCSIETIEGRFFSVQSNGQIKERKEKISIRDVDYSIDRKRFEIQDEYLVRLYIYVDDESSRMKRSYVSNSYTHIPINRLEIDEIIPYFRKYFYCVKKQEYIQEQLQEDKINNNKTIGVEVVYCQLDEGCPHLIKGENCICGYPDSQCNFREFKQ